MRNHRQNVRCKHTANSIRMHAPPIQSPSQFASVHVQHVWRYYLRLQAWTYVLSKLFSGSKSLALENVKRRSCEFVHYRSYLRMHRNVHNE
eukprot:5133493-Pleurochrysis_carterae.AAC.1